MSQISFRVDSADLMRKLEKLGSLKAAEVLAVSAASAGETVAAEMRRRAPDSGESRTSNRKKNHKGKLYPFKLKEDIRVKSAKVDHRGVLVRTVVLPYYAGMVEKGTSKQSPNPFIKKSAQSAKPQAVAKFQEGVKNMVEAAFR